MPVFGYLSSVVRRDAVRRLPCSSLMASRSQRGRGRGGLPEAPTRLLSKDMKKQASSDPSSTRKGSVLQSVDEYLAGVPEPGRSTLNQVRATIRSVVPAEATEVISYGMPGFRYKGPLMWYAAFSKHCSLFPGNASLVETFKDELKDYQTAKGTIRFPVDKPLPTALLKKLVKARVKENERKYKS